MTWLPSKEASFNSTQIFYKDTLLISTNKDPLFYPIFYVLERG